MVNQVKDDWAILALGGLSGRRVISYAGGRSRKKLESIAKKMNEEPQRDWCQANIRYIVRLCIHKEKNN